MDIQDYIDQYIKWLKNGFTFQKMGEYFEITTPFLDPNNDSIQIYVKKNNNTIYFSDDCHYMNTLLSYGLKLTPKRKNQIVSLLNQYGVQLNDKELIMKADETDYPQRKHMFIQAILRLSDMYFTSRTKTSSLFTEDVSDYFEKNEIYCSENIQILGKTGFLHKYDFIIQRSKNKPERLCMAMNTPNRNYMNSILFSWDDTRQTRRMDSQLIVIMNDENKIPAGVEKGFQNYDVQTIKWSARNDPKSINLLSA